MAEYSQYPPSSQMAGPVFPSSGMPYMNQPSMGFTQSPAGFHSASQLPCISGPPSFIHVNGVTYKPVDDAHSKAGHVESGSRVSEAAPEPAPRVLTDEDIDRRVRDRVESWASSQRKPVAQSAGRSGGNRSLSEEDRVAARIHSVNENIRGRFRSPV